MAERRTGKFIWVTWLSKLMIGEASCVWSIWFKTRYKYEKIPGDFDHAKWQVTHNRMLHELKSEREQVGEKVFTENQNYFRFEVRPNLVVAGKPDLIAVSGDNVTIYDCKTGQPRDSDTIQMMLYMYCTPLCLATCKDKKPRGVLIYSTDSIEIPADAIDTEFIGNFDYFIDILNSNEPPKKVPSTSECQFCDITSADCPERVNVNMES